MLASIHFPLAREDKCTEAFGRTGGRFNPLPSCEGRPFQLSYDMFFNHASIHFPLAREDNSMTFYDLILGASIHFPLAREDNIQANKKLFSTVLQSTSLLRGKTLLFLCYRNHCKCFNPLPSCEGTPGSPIDTVSPTCFNPLPSCEGRPDLCTTEEA